MLPVVHQMHQSCQITENVDVKVKAQTEHDMSLEVTELGLADDDETIGIEREAALKSPPKGKFVFQVL